MPRARPSSASASSALPSAPDAASERMTGSNRPGPKTRARRSRRCASDMLSDSAAGYGLMSSRGLVRRVGGGRWGGRTSPAAGEGVVIRLAENKLAGGTALATDARNRRLRDAVVNPERLAVPVGTVTALHVAWQLDDAARRGGKQRPLRVAHALELRR